MKPSLEISAIGTVTPISDSIDAPSTSPSLSPAQSTTDTSEAEKIIPATAIPAATPVERGRFVLHLHNRDEDTDDEDDDDNNSVASSGNNDFVDNGNSNDKNDNNNNNDAPDSPKSFNSDEIFDDVEQNDINNVIPDQDLERLLGPTPSRRSSNNSSEKHNNNNTKSSLEVDSSDSSEGSSRRSKKTNRKGLCPCCPNVVRRGPCQCLAGMMGWNENLPNMRVGNMIMVLPSCVSRWGFGIMGPHWFGPVACLLLLTIATIHFAPKAYHHIGPISGIICLLFYILGVVSLCIVTCSDPGVVKSGTAGGAGGIGGRDGGYAGLPRVDVSAGRGWRYCDLCSVYQPPDAVHCPECNVCVEGYDHHCPWMGTCIGKKNFTSFMVFNLTWLFYLLYAIIWVVLFGRTFYGTGAMIEHSGSSGDE